MPVLAALLFAVWGAVAAAPLVEQASCPVPTAAPVVRSQAPALLQVEATKTSAAGGQRDAGQIDGSEDEEEDASKMAADRLWLIDDATPEKAELSVAATKKTSSSSGGSKFTLLCWNVLYTNFNGGSRADLHGVANVMMEMGSDVAGLQECMNIDTMQGYLGDRMQMARGSDWPNCIFYKAAADIRLGEHHGRRYLNRDNYSERFVSYAQLFHHGKEFWLFNTHWCLHGPCGGAAGGQKHRQAAEIMTNLRQELGAGSKPALITGDLNSMMDGFDNDDGVQWLLNHGFEISAKGPTYGGIDYIFTSRGHWDVSNHVDRTWSHPSDHAPFTVDLALVGC